MSQHELTVRLESISKLARFRHKGNRTLSCLEFISRVANHLPLTDWGREALRLYNDGTIVCPSSGTCYISNMLNVRDFLSWYSSTQGGTSPLRLLSFAVSQENCSVKISGNYFLYTNVVFASSISSGQVVGTKKQVTKNTIVRARLRLLKRRFLIQILFRVGRPGLKQMAVRSKVLLRWQKKIRCRATPRLKLSKKRRIMNSTSAYVPILNWPSQAFLTHREPLLFWERGGRFLTELWRKMFVKWQVDTDVWDIYGLLPSLKWEER